jgi:RND family efflux transporter MFP subunit
VTAGHPSAWRRLLLVPPIVAGILVLAWLVSGKAPPERVEHREPTRTVRVVVVPAVDLVPTAEGYGPVRPARVWAAVAQVQGRVTAIHPRLRDGEILRAGAELARIDPVDYELSLAEARAQLAELEVRERNARASLAIEERSLAIAEQELERRRELARAGNASASAVDETERAMLAARTAVQNQRNTLALIPAERRLLEAKAARAERDLERTVIRAPFDLRVANLEVEADQFVTVGQTLFEGDSVDRVEIQAQVALASLRPLVLGLPEAQIDVMRMTDRLPELLGLTPLVRLDLGDQVAEWPAEFVRFGDEVDPQTRTLGVVVAVDRPFEKIVPGRRPALSKGMFVQVVLRGRPQPGRVIVPRSAVRGGRVLVADADGRLRRRAVSVLFAQGRLAVIGEGVTPGDRIVVSDLVPAVEGMLLVQELDTELAASLLAGATGGSP